MKMKHPTKKAIAAIVALTAPVWIVGAMVALPAITVIFIIVGIYDDVLKFLNKERPEGPW